MARVLTALGASLGALLTALLGIARADEFHFETFRYGQKAMGMGGAAAGQPFEPEASYYNPAGLALLGSGARFSGALNFFGYDRRIQKGALRDSGLFAPSDLESTAFLPTPSGSVVSTRFAKRHAIAFSTFLLGDLSEEFVGTLAAGVDGDPVFDAVDFNSSFIRRDRLQLRGLTYAYSPDDRWSAGISVFWLEHAREETARRAQILSSEGVITNLFIDVTSREKTVTHGLLARVGVAWRPTAAGSFGAACTLPTIPLTGEATYRYTLVTSGDGEASGPLYIDEGETVAAETRLPVNCRLGAALQATDRWQIAGDLSLHLPIEYQRFVFAGDAVAREAAFRASVATDTTINLALGAEYRLTDRWPIRFGLFTNRTSAPEVPARPDRFVPPHLDLYGATLSAGYLGDERSINLGLEVQYGAGQDVVSEGIESLLDSQEFSRVDRSEWRIVIFIAGAASFAKAAAVDLIQPALGDAPKDASKDDAKATKTKWSE